MFEDRNLKIMTYNIETIIAEKFQTVISRGILNSRMKDYYDLYYLITYKDYSKENLKKAIQNTFTKRNTDIKIVNKTIKEIEKSDFIRDLWIAYSKKYKYANDIEFIEIMEKIREIVNLIKYQINVLNKCLIFLLYVATYLKNKNVKRGDTNGFI